MWLNALTTPRGRQERLDELARGGARVVEVIADAVDLGAAPARDPRALHRRPDAGATRATGEIADALRASLPSSAPALAGTGV
jgi:hypothetical protein